MVTATPDDVIAEAKRLLDKSGCAAQSLSISDEYLMEGEWLHLLVVPTVEGVSALDYVDAVESIESALRDKFGDEILMVPAKP